MDLHTFLLALANRPFPFSTLVICLLPFAVQLADAEEGHETTVDQVSSRPPDSEGGSSQSGGTTQDSVAHPTKEQKSTESQGNHISAAVDSAIETPVKEAMESKAKSGGGEKAETSPKTLRELSKEASHISSATGSGSSENIPVDEGIDMKGNG